MDGATISFCLTSHHPFLVLSADSEGDEDAVAAMPDRGEAAPGGAATLSRHRMPVCRLSFSPAASPRAEGAATAAAQQRRCALFAASSDADGDDECVRDTEDCVVSLACSEELEERLMSPPASPSQPLSPVRNVTGALHDMILRVRS